MKSARGYVPVCLCVVLTFAAWNAFSSKMFNPCTGLEIKAPTMASPLLSFISLLWEKLWTCEAREALESWHGTARTR